MSNTVQTIQASTNNAIGLMATPCMLADQDHKARVTFPADGAREHTEHDDNTSYLPALTAECERHRLTLQLTDDPNFDLPVIETIDGVRTFLVRSDALGIALDELRLGGSCTVYPGLCTSIDGEDGDQTDENGRHFDHGSHAIGVPGLEVEGDPEIWAEFTHVSAGTPPHIGFMGFDLTPDQARVKAREMRQFADELDTLADRVATARALHDVRTVRETASPSFAGILTIVETAIARDGADPTEVFDHVLKLMDQASAAA